MDPLFAVSDAIVFTGKLYDQAFVQSCKRDGFYINDKRGGGFASGKFNGKEIACWIVPRCMGGGRWSSTTLWKINGKRVAQKKLIGAVCEAL